MSEQVTNPAKEAFLKAKQEREARDKAAKDAENNTNFYNDWKPIKWVGLEDNKYVVLRLLGLPHEAPKEIKKSTDCKVILQSEIKKDDGKGYTKINWPMVERDSDRKFVPDPDWILTKLYKEVRSGSPRKFDESDLSRPGFTKGADGKVVNADKKKGEYEYFHKDKQCFKRVDKKGNTREGDFEKSFYPSTKILMNVIHKNDNWCVENKQSKLLSTKVSEYKFHDEKENKEKIIYYPNTGITNQLYGKIFGHVMDFRSDWDIDIAIEKYQPSPSSNQRDYRIKDATDYNKLDDDLKKIMTENPLTKEEQEYDLYDLDELFPVSSYAKIKRHLKGLFKLVDSELGTDFEDQLNLLVEEEKAEREKKKAEKEEKELNEGTPVENTERPEVTEEPKEVVEEKKEETQPKGRSRKPEPEINTSNDYSANFPAYDKLNKEEKAFIESGAVVKFEGTIPVWAEPQNIEFCANKECFYKDTNERTKYPLDINTCPVCGNYDS